MIFIKQQILELLLVYMHLIINLFLYWFNLLFCIIFRFYHKEATFNLSLICGFIPNGIKRTFQIQPNDIVIPRLIRTNR